MLNYPTMMDTSTPANNNNEYSAFTPVSSDLSSYTSSGLADHTTGTGATKTDNYKDYINNNAPIDTNTAIHPVNDPITDRFLMHKGSDNSKRFSVNNLLQLANCSGSKLGGE